MIKKCKKFIVFPAHSLYFLAFSFHVHICSYQKSLQSSVEDKRREDGGGKYGKCSKFQAPGLFEAMYSELTLKSGSLYGGQTSGSFERDGPVRCEA